MTTLYELHFELFPTVLSKIWAPAPMLAVKRYNFNEEIFTETEAYFEGLGKSFKKKDVNT